MAGEHIVLVHGALCTAGIWERLAKELDARGIGHVEMDLSSVQPGVDAHTAAGGVVVGSGPSRPVRPRHRQPPVPQVVSAGWSG